MKLEVKGLHTYSSELSGVPAGALSVARNVDITRQNIVGPRRGYNYLNNDLPLSADRASKLVFYNSDLFAHYNGATFATYNSDGIAFIFVDGDVTVGTDKIAETAHLLKTGDKGQFTSTGTLPAGLSLATDYYAIRNDADTFQIATTEALALAGTAVDITSAASGGNHTFTPDGWLGRGALIAPTTAPSIKAARMNKNLFLTSSSGLQKMDDTASSIFQAGLPQGIHTTAVLTALGSGGGGTAIAGSDNVA